MERLGKALDRESYEWLASHAADILEAVEAEVNAGRSPEQIRLYVIRVTSRAELAQRCEQAARHIKAMEVR
jgi:hypothetical protein